MFIRKAVIATTGLFLCLFLIVHLSANCLLFLPEATARGLYNAYSTTLRESPLIKGVAYVLYASILLHVVYAAIVTYKNRKARPVVYAVNRHQENSSWTSQNMGLLGVAILIFIVVHLANFWARIKLGIGTEVKVDSRGLVDVYEVTRDLFRNPLYVGFYAVLMVPLGLHLNHGLKSAFKSLGFYHRAGLRLLTRVSLAYAAVVSTAFGVIPLVMYFRLL